MCSERIATIEVPKDPEYNAPRWDGTNPKTGKKDLGEYRIRWTLNGESRIEPVWVETGPNLLRGQRSGSARAGADAERGFSRVRRPYSTTPKAQA